MPERSSGPAPIHLRPAAELAERVLLPGDPHRALMVAQALLEGPRMFNHHRGLWGYTGTAPDGLPLTIQATGMGGPSAAIVVEELIALGARRLVRIGTCGALSRDLALGELLVVSEALSLDGASRALGSPERVMGDPSLTAAVAPAARRGIVASVDLFYPPEAGTMPGALGTAALAVEMETATVFRLGELRGVATASVLAVSDLLADEGRTRIDAEALELAGVRLGEAALAALSA